MTAISASIQRQIYSDQGTEGKLSIPSLGGVFFTLELPWRSNQQNVSCVPPGQYDCRVVNSPRFKRVYLLLSVPNRSHVLIHSGNFAGDTSKGFRTHVQGCILLGTKRGKIYGQRAVLMSRIAIRRFMALVADDPIHLTISK